MLNEQEWYQHYDETALHKITLIISYQLITVYVVDIQGLDGNMQIRLLMLN